MRRELLIVGIVVVALGAAAGLAIAARAGDDDQALTGATLQRATAAALAHTGGGKVVETEVGDDGAAYGVEVRMDDGRVVEVNVDENFDVIGQEADEDGAGDEDEARSND
jgi:uncharacterized membrane protein YkoI